MKQWLEGHPKAKLMARKRAAILDAAHGEFLGRGFEATTMEAVAAAAKVSIMTLYRHADDKEDLFRAVIARACESAGEAARTDLDGALAQPLDEALHARAMRFQQHMAGKETVALLRAVTIETTRFPDLAETAWQALVGTHRDATIAFLALRAETRSLGAAERRRLASDFLDGLVGTDLLEILLGLRGGSAENDETRARAAAAKILAALPPHTPDLRIV